jgi:hypothetical protein
MLLNISSFCTTHKSSVSTGLTEQIMPILHILFYNGSLVTCFLLYLPFIYPRVGPNGKRVHWLAIDAYMPQTVPVITSRHWPTENIALVLLCLHSLPHRCVYNAGRNTENIVPLLLYHCCFRVCCCGNVFAEPLPRNVSDIFAYLAVVV